MDQMYKKFGLFVTVKLRSVGMEEKELAEKIGISADTLEKYLSAKVIPRGPIMAKIADVLEFDINDFR